MHAIINHIHSTCCYKSLYCHKQSSPAMAHQYMMCNWFAQGALSVWRSSWIGSFTMKQAKTKAELVSHVFDWLIVDYSPTNFKRLHLCKTQEDTSTHWQGLAGLPAVIADRFMALAAIDSDLHWSLNLQSSAFWSVHAVQPFGNWCLVHHAAKVALAQSCGAHCKKLWSTMLYIGEVYVCCKAQLVSKPFVCASGR